MPRPSHFATAAFGALFLAGCGGERLETVPVAGVVTCKGRPVAYAQVMFSPQEVAGRAADDLGKPALGMTDEQGRFVLSTYGNEDGAAAGRHAVSVTLAYDEELGGIDPNDKFPCAGASKEVTVAAGAGEVKIEL